MTDRLFTDPELTGLTRTPRQELIDCLDVGSEVKPVAASIARSYCDQIGGVRSWVGCVFACIGERHGLEGLARAVAATSRFYAALAEVDAARSDVDAESTVDDAHALVDRIAELATAGDHDGALDILDGFEAACRMLQDQYRDWLSALLSVVYRTWGPDELEQVHRYCAERTLLPWMTTDIGNQPEKRLVRWVRMLRGHFSRLRVWEDEEKFVIVQDPCGTCARQIMDGRYDPPLDLAVVEEQHVVTWGRGSTPIYRTHVPVWHVAMARERLGVPWPVNRCPAGLGTGPCETFLYKDPLDPRANGCIPS